MERIPLLHLDLCWRVILNTAYSPIHLFMLVCQTLLVAFSFLPRVRDLDFLGFFFSNSLEAVFQRPRK